jgi:hypothetical protein
MLHSLSEDAEDRLDEPIMIVTEAGSRHNTIALRSAAAGAKIKFFEERCRYTIRAADGRWFVCTKPFNLRRTTLYTIIDLERQERGRENLVFGMGFETDEDCQRALERLENGESEVSYRHCIPLVIERVDWEA